ncbi:MAG: hypothetical protein NT149_00435 [Candidatus Gottesmanbacteria bacterium]|nr:hypothetical protein [Candidatus Gottesmanbacteria bacterium]
MTPAVIPSYVLLTLKIFSIVGLLIYAVFAGVLVRQEQLMAHVLEEQFQPIIRALVIAHLIATVVLLLLAIILL